MLDAGPALVPPGRLVAALSTPPGISRRLALHQGGVGMALPLGMQGVGGGRLLSSWFSRARRALLLYCFPGPLGLIEPGRAVGAWSAGFAGAACAGPPSGGAPRCRRCRSVACVKAGGGTAGNAWGCQHFGVFLPGCAGVAPRAMPRRGQGVVYGVGGVTLCRSGCGPLLEARVGWGRAAAPLLHGLGAQDPCVRWARLVGRTVPPPKLLMLQHR